jgi:hypothetical protein
MIKAIDHGRRSYPPYGQYTYPRGKTVKFSAIEIKPIKQFPQLRPDGMRSPTAEVRILGKYIAKLQNRASLNGDILSI